MFVSRVCYILKAGEKSLLKPNSVKRVVGNERMKVCAL